MGEQLGAKGPTRRSDPAVEAEIHERLLPGLRMVLRHKLGASAAVEDLVQEALILVLEHWRSGEIADSVQLAAFARASALHLCANLKRADRRREHLSLEMAYTLEPELEPSPEAIFLEAENVGMVRSAVAELGNLRDRHLLWRYYVQEESKSAICATLALDPRRFDKVLHRARSRLREHMLRTGVVGGTSAALETLPTKADAE